MVMITLKCRKIGAVKFYTIIGTTLYAMIDIFRVIDKFEQFFQIQRANAQQQVVKIKDICEKVIYMKFGLRE